MDQFYSEISKINENINTIFITPVTLASYFDVALIKRNAGQGSTFCEWLFSCNVSGCQKTVPETKCYLSTTTDRPAFLSAQRIISICL